MRYDTNNIKFISYLLILFSLFILFFVTKDQFFQYSEKWDMKETLETDLVDKESQLKEMEQLKQKLASNTVEAYKDIEKYMIDMSEDQLYAYFFNFVESTNNEDSRIFIKDISMSQGRKNELWFTESQININLRVSSEQAMLNFLNFVIDPESKYNFFLNTFNYHFDEREGSFNVSVPLLVFYK